MVGDHGSTSSCLTNLQSCLGNREIKSLSTKQIPHPGKLKLCHTVFSVPSSSPPPTLTQPHPLGLTLSGLRSLPTLPTRQAQGVGREGIWDLVPARSPVGWHWAHLKVSQTFCQCVFLRGLVTKDGLFPPREHRDSMLCLSAHCILSLSLGSLPNFPLSANPPCPQDNSKVSA